MKSKTWIWWSQEQHHLHGKRALKIGPFSRYFWGWIPREWVQGKALMPHANISRKWQMKMDFDALASVALWIDRPTVNQRITGSIPSSGHMPRLQTRSPVRGTWEATAYWCFSPFLSPSLPFSLNTNKYNLSKKRKNFERWVPFPFERTYLRDWDPLVILSSFGTDGNYKVL